MNPVVERIFATELTHRGVPWPVARRAVLAMADRAWERDGQLREDAGWQMRYLVGASERAGEVDELAHAYVREVYLRLERYWRPWQTTRTPPGNLRRLEALRDAGRAVIVSFMHQGDLFSGVGALCAAGMPLHIPVWTGIVDSTTKSDDSTYFRTVKAQTGRAMRAIGGIPIESVGSRDRIRELLEAGRMVAIAADVPGDNEIPMLGRTVGVAGGTSRLAFETGVPVIALTVRKEGENQVFNCEVELQPTDFASPKGLLKHMMSLQERSILAWPEGLERPLRRWRLSAGDEAEFGAAERMSLKI